MKPIQVWRFDDAPSEYQKLSQNGGDEDFVVFVPSEYGDFWAPWIDATDACRDPEVHEVKGGKIYIGSHA